MAEQTQNTDIFADFTVTEPSVIQSTPIIQPIKEKQEKKEEDIFSGFTSTDTVQTKDDDIFSEFTVTGEDKSVKAVPQKTKKYSNAALIRY